MYLALAHAGALGDFMFNQFVVNDSKVQALGEPGGDVLAERRHLAGPCDYVHTPPLKRTYHEAPAMKNVKLRSRFRLLLPGRADRCAPKLPEARRIAPISAA